MSALGVASVGHPDVPSPERSGRAARMPGRSGASGLRRPSTARSHRSSVGSVSCGRSSPFRSSWPRACWRKLTPHSYAFVFAFCASQGVHRPEPGHHLRGPAHRPPGRRPDLQPVAGRRGAARLGRPRPDGPRGVSGASPTGPAPPRDGHRGPSSTSAWSASCASGRGRRCRSTSSSPWSRDVGGGRGGAVRAAVGRPHHRLRALVVDGAVGDRLRGRRLRRLLGGRPGGPPGAGRRRARGVRPPAGLHRPGQRRGADGAGPLGVHAAGRAAAGAPRGVHEHDAARPAPLAEPADARPRPPAAGGAGARRGPGGGAHPAGPAGPARGHGGRGRPPGLGAALRPRGHGPAARAGGRPPPAGRAGDRRLYGHLEAASEERRRLLAQVMQRADGDRHRVAAELHEQAVSAYASFVSFIQAVGAPGGPGSTERSPGAGFGAVAGAGRCPASPGCRRRCATTSPATPIRCGT